MNTETVTISPEDRARMIARRNRFGTPAIDSDTVLDDLLSHLAGDNLAYALVYEGFATERAAYRIAGVNL